jgi:nucleotide-binding universal stress UspA family protein
VLVALATAEGARAAVVVARTLALPDCAPLHVVHLGPDAGAAPDALKSLGLGAAEIDGAVVDIPTGDPAEWLLDLAVRRNARAVVLSSGAAPCAPSRVAETLLTRADIPVVFVRADAPETPWEPRRVLLPLDGTPASALAIDPALALARSRGGSVDLLHVAGLRAPATEEPGSIAAPAYTDQPQHEWPAWSREFVARGTCRDVPPSGGVRLKVVTGVPGHEIVRFADVEGVDLIVLGWHGRLDGERAQTLRTVLEHARCPVMVTRAR